MKAYFESLSPYQCLPPYQSDMFVTSGWMRRGAKGTTDSDGTSRCWFSRTLINATSTVYLPALRSANIRLTVSVAFPVDTSTLTPNFFENASTTGRYWRDGAPPEAMPRVPSCFAAATSLDHSCSKLAEDCGAAAPKADGGNKAHRTNRTHIVAMRSFNVCPVSMYLSFMIILPCATSPMPTQCGHRAEASAILYCLHRQACGARRRS